ncbi:MAG: outer membrane protein assembly factor BamA [Caldimicrobium sp.]|nr:outer membrane protein assembly factor BamA [Caldimicrobium sp.]MCX7873888.1 outer membrane protein assembly factor BamA [Caldimicrobium sp.]MDW8094828.1 outer membrane protein assembly factor BamA [Caldimicrobium sp.]
MLQVYPLILSFFLFFGLFSSVKAQDKILLYKVTSFGEPVKEELLNQYLNSLQDQIKAVNLSLERKNYPEDTALKFLRGGEYSAIAELRLTLIKDTLSLDWKILPLGKREARYFFVVGRSTNLHEAVANTIKELEGILKEKLYIEKIRFVGTRRLGEDFLLPKLRSKAGESLDPKKVNEDIKMLFKLGYFEHVEALMEEGERGVVLVYKVEERESIKEITFKGIKEAKKEDLAKIIELKPGDIPTPEKLTKALENLKAYYEQLGFHQTEINLKTEKVGPAQINLVFEIKEGKKKYIKKIEFLGNKALSERELKGFLSVTERSVFSPIAKYARYLTAVISPEPKAEPGVYNLAYLQRDLGKIETAYKNRGYIEVRIGEPQVIEEDDGVIIRIPIEEGAQYKVKEVQIEHDLFPPEEIKKRIKTQPGKVFNLGELRNDEVILTHLFTDYGYAYAKVLTTFEKVQEGNLLKVAFKVDKGPIVFVNRIEIEGNTRTRDKVIRREILLGEGWPYSGRRLEKSEERLRRLGFFEDVKIEKERGAKEEELNLKVKVKEALTGTFSIGAAYSSAEKFVFMTEITQRNWLGKGQRVSISAKIGSRSSRYSLNFFDPYFRDTRYSFGWSLYNYETKFEDYTKDSKGGSLRFGYTFSPEFSAYIGYRYDDSKIKDLIDNASVIIRESKEMHVTSAFEVGAVYDSRNRFFMPTKGWYHELGLSYAGGFLGGDSNFAKFTAEHQVYVPFGGLTGHLVLGYGYITEGSGKRVPVFERFYLGGISSVRGYKFGDISPRDETTGERIGGTRMFFSQVEGIFPLIKAINLNGVVFFDMGTVWSQKYKFRTSEIRKSVGLGIRWFSPLGPLRIEWGYNVDKKPGEDSSNLNFQIGGSF